MKRFTNRIITYLLMTSVIVIITYSGANAQESTFRQQSWRYGINGALQFNSACLGWQQLHNLEGNFHSPADDVKLVDGTGMGIYGGLFGEYLSNSWWGIQMRISYDMRNALVEDISRLPVPSFDTKMSYLTFEPLFRVDQNLVPKLNFYVGPVLAILINGAYQYKPDVNKSDVEQEITPSGLNGVTYGLQGGMAYDISVSEIDINTSIIASPFFDFSWLGNQRESLDEVATVNQNSINDIWSTMSYRLGVRLSLENREPNPFLKAEAKAIITPPITNAVYVELPYQNTILTKNVKGYFPIHPYVFFEKGSQEIPSRYKMLSKSEAQNFNETDLEDFMKGDMTTKQTNVDQLMETYHNILNIMGDRMRKNTNEKLTLRGSDPDNIDGEAIANKVKDYLVNNFGINPNRITTEAEAPRNPSGSEFTEAVSKNLIKDENRRVVFAFNNQEMLKPVPYTIRDETSFDNDMIFSIDNKVPYKSWDVTISGEGKTMYFGPFIYSSERINPAELMRFLESGKYTAEVVITDKNNIKTKTSMDFKLIKDKEIRNASRYLMLFDYNESNAIAKYEKKIREEIVPGMVIGDKVIVHGHTDVIGNENGNLILSQERANQAKEIIDNELSKENKNIEVKAVGIGQRKMQYTFDNRYPEGRMYNRNIFVEIIK